MTHQENGGVIGAMVIGWKNRIGDLSSISSWCCVHKYLTNDAHINILKKAQIYDFFSYLWVKLFGDWTWWLTTLREWQLWNSKSGTWDIKVLYVCACTSTYTCICVFMCAHVHMWMCVQIRSSTEKFIDWSRYSYRIWLNKFIIQLCGQHASSISVAVVKKQAINSRHDIVVWIFQQMNFSALQSNMW